jgi:hypothetical protein
VILLVEDDVGQLVTMHVRIARAGCVTSRTRRTGGLSNNCSFIAGTLTSRLRKSSTPRINAHR